MNVCMSVCMYVRMYVCMLNPMQLRLTVVGHDPCEWGPEIGGETLCEPCVSLGQWVALPGEYEPRKGCAEVIGGTLCDPASLLSVPPLLLPPPAPA